MNEIAQALATGLSAKHKLAFYSPEDWAPILAAYDAGASGGALYRALLAAGKMPYHSDRSFFRALENAHLKRDRGPCVRKRMTK